MDLDKVIKQIKTQKDRKFDESIEISVAFVAKKGNDASSVRLEINLPHTFGKEKKVLVLCDKNEVDKADGADYIGLDEYVEKIKTGWKDFDVVIATPTVMPKIAILGKYLGAAGLMPNPKNGTVTMDLTNAIKAFKSGKTNLKANKSGQLQLVVAKKSMTEEEIKDNLEYIIKTISENLAKSFNSTIKVAYVKTSMGSPYRLL